MFILIKYSCIVFFCIGLFGFAFYTHFCNLSDKAAGYIEKSLYKLEEEYDYIVVGAGSAGSVLALRLSEDRNVSVLLLEAGGYGGKLLDIPVIAPILHKTVYDWQYETVPQKHGCRALKNNISSWPHGKLIGGTGRLNLMMYTRGHPEDFKEWYENAEDYSFEWDILQFFKKAENQKGLFSNDSKYHGTNGPLIVDDLHYVSELYEAVVEAASTMGLPVRDVNGKFNSGFSQPQVNLKNGSRFSTGHYLLQHRHRPNLIIKTHSHVEKVHFKDNYEAYAVKHEILGETYVTRARRAVVLSAGAIGTPKILMLSGVGKESHLKDVGVKVVGNLPVGDNLQDHISTGFDLGLLERPLSMNFYTLSSPVSHFKYFLQASGPLTSVGCEMFALLNSNCIDGRTEYDLCETLSGRPDLELIFMPVGLSSDQGLHFKDTVNIKDEIWNDYFSHLTHNNTITVLPIVLHPKSKGTVRLRDKNPSSKPLIDPNYLSEQSDVNLLVKGIRFVKRFVDTPAMRDLGARFNKLKFPGCKNLEYDTDVYWECYVRHLSLTLYHPVGTCKMGGVNDRASVVDRDFRVIGTNKLFVADASVMPSLVSANTNAAVVMLSEKAASILKYYKYLEQGVCTLKETLLKSTICTIY